MKLTEIDTHTVYWYDTATDWGKYLSTSFDRFPFVRVDDKRYRMAGSRFDPKFHEDERGRYIRVQPLSDQASPHGAHRHILPTHVRGTFDEVKAAYEKIQAAKKVADEARQVKATEMFERASVLRARLAALGVEGIAVTSTDGLGWRADLPTVKVEFESTLRDPADTLAAILDRLEAAEKRASIAEADAAHLSNGGAADGWSPGRPAAVREGVDRFDPDLADRLEHGGDRYQDGRDSR